MDARFFSDSYDLYRPTVTTGDSGEQTVADPDAATASDQPCRYFPTPGQVTPGETGLTLEYDAVILYPSAQTLRPEKFGQQPDHVEIDGRKFAVLIAWALAGQSYANKALLKERRS